MSFNIRVYGVLINENKGVLVTNEVTQDGSFTKFPGGGLEFGEGLKECLEREFYEELRLSVRIGDLFYLTEHFQQSAFKVDEQLLSVYYKVYALEEGLLETVVMTNENNIKVKPHWMPINVLREDLFMFPIDKIVVRQILNTF